MEVASIIKRTEVDKTTVKKKRKKKRNATGFQLQISIELSLEETTKTMNTDNTYVKNEETCDLNSGAAASIDEDRDPESGFHLPVRG